MTSPPRGARSPLGPTIRPRTCAMHRKETIPIRTSTFDRLRGTLMEHSSMCGDNLNSDLALFYSRDKGCYWDLNEVICRSWQSLSSDGSVKIRKTTSTSLCTFCSGVNMLALNCKIHIASDGFNFCLNPRFLLSLLAAQDNSIDAFHKVSDAGEFDLAKTRTSASLGHCFSRRSSGRQARL